MLRWGYADIENENWSRMKSRERNKKKIRKSRVERTPLRYDKEMDELGVSPAKRP